MILPPYALDVLTDYHRLLLVRIGWLQLQPFAVLVLRKDILRNLPLVTFDQRISRLHNQLRTPIVLFQFEEFCIVVLALEVQDIVDVRTSERIDALCIVAHHAHLLTFLRELIDNGLLCKVRVLILIHEHKMEFFYVFLADFLMILKQKPRLDEQIIEIHRIGLSAPFRVPYIYVRYLRTLLTGIIPSPGTLSISLRQQ